MIIEADDVAEVRSRITEGLMMRMLVLLGRHALMHVLHVKKMMRVGTITRLLGQRDGYKLTWPR
jgi:hypothetical protein